jgi:hypothetical protein
MLGRKKQRGEIAGTALPRARRALHDDAKITRHVGLVVVAAGGRDVGERGPGAQSRRGALDADDARQRFRGEADMGEKQPLVTMSCTAALMS